MKIIFYRDFNTIFYCQDKNASTTLDAFFNTKSKVKPLVYFDNSCRYTSSNNLKLEIFNVKKQVFQFTVVRNTWDRMVSLYSMLKKQIAKNKKLHPWFDRFGSDLSQIFFNENSFEIFIEYICSFSHHSADSHWQDQYIALPFKDDNFYIGRFESLNHDFSYICRKMGLTYETLNVSSNSTKYDRPSYRTFYNKHTKNLIKHRYRKEINIFGFKF